ncbi:MAG: hypothetical protein U0805_12845 [Pirellulales bacterium]
MHSGLISLRDALRAFVEAEATQSQLHIRPLHRHIVERLVIEGGFRPDDISPHPPLRIEVGGGGRDVRHRLVYDESAACTGEQTVLGGLKTKDVDVVISQRHIGPSLAVSVKGTSNAFRNLTNRMEEAAGDCTNLHIAYPALVYGFLHVMRANLAKDVSNPNDVAIQADGTIVQTIKRYHDAMARITNRSDMRNDVSRYEAVAIALVHPRGDNIAEVVNDFPLSSSPLAFDRFFERLYAAYDLRFVYSAPALHSTTRRLEWDPGSPIMPDAQAAGFVPRFASE